MTQLYTDRPVAADVPLPPVHSLEQSNHVATMLYIVDFLAQFSKVLAMKPVSFQDFCHSLYSTAAIGQPTDATAKAAATAEQRLHGSDLVALAAPDAIVNGHAERAPGTLSNVLGNGLLASIDAAAQDADGDSTVLFDVYRGLLQFLLQVNTFAL